MKSLINLQRWAEAVTACQNGNRELSLCTQFLAPPTQMEFSPTALTQFPEDNTFIAWKKKSEVSVSLWSGVRNARCCFSHYPPLQANVVSFSQYITADRWALIIALVQIFMLVNVVRNANVGTVMADVSISELSHATPHVTFLCSCRLYILFHSHRP